MILQETMKGEISLENGCGQAYFPARPWLEEIKEKAAALGVEMLVLDDGWFGKRNDDNSGWATGS